MFSREQPRYLVELNVRGLRLQQVRNSGEGRGSRPPQYIWKWKCVYDLSSKAKRKPPQHSVLNNSKTHWRVTEPATVGKIVCSYFKFTDTHVKYKPAWYCCCWRLRAHDAHRVQSISLQIILDIHQQSFWNNNNYSNEWASFCTAIS